MSSSTLATKSKVDLGHPKTRQPGRMMMGIFVGVDDESMFLKNLNVEFVVFFGWTFLEKKLGIFH